MPGTRTGRLCDIQHGRVIVDGTVATGFTIVSSAGPASRSLVNEACGWNLR